MSSTPAKAVPHVDSFEWIERPVGPQPIPKWCTGAVIDWIDGYSNAPAMKIKTSENPCQWPDKAWIYEGDGVWRAYSDDGRVEQHVHKGSLTWDDAKQAWLTPQQRGYAGRHFEIQMKYGSTFEQHGQRITFTRDRRTVILRGPWHTGGPKGYIGVVFYDTSNPYNEREHFRPRTRHWRPWHRRTLCFGLMISVELWLRIIARYQPTVRVARCDYGSYRTLEPVREDWDEPKRWALRSGAEQVQR
ncbi:hypothetical protein DYI24_00745 [Rhodopseudomonas sp. BR0C11]|uniref:hypothetical protein n=1 Tax=Rhodopseudomonas sp. BR0C11 TaxID=2269370 RepID=UPI0013DF09E7|nr:hypothetical protein [Rhodopseudomonas sp. BR0C11]NEV75606.1 hypothetical protein [Rhodopseudomonas sp. BR0C11]